MARVIITWDIWRQHAQLVGLAVATAAARRLDTAGRAGGRHLVSFPLSVHQFVSDFTLRLSDLIYLIVKFFNLSFHLLRADHFRTNDLTQVVSNSFGDVRYQIS